MINLQAQYQTLARISTKEDNYTLLLTVSTSTSTLENNVTSL
jgi:hypothetical protein